MFDLIYVCVSQCISLSYVLILVEVLMSAEVLVEILMSVEVLTLVDM